MRFFTADEHYLDEEILKYCRRPFKSVSDNTKQLIYEHNKVVGKDDRVYHLGDFSESKDKEALRKILLSLNGWHTLIKGNHDSLELEDYLEVGFTDVFKLYETLQSGAYKIVLAHDPTLYNCIPDEEFLTYMLCGHVHRLFRQIKRVVNVGVDVRCYKPISEYEVISLFGEIA